MADRKKGLSLEEFQDHLQSLDDLHTPELITIKGHLLLEAALYRVLAVRLGVSESDLPRLGFPVLADLALVGQKESKDVKGRALLLNNIRNEFAHQLTPLDQERRMRELVTLSIESRTWPTEQALQARVYAETVKELVTLTILTGVILELPPDRVQQLQANLAKHRQTILRLVKR